MYAANTVRVAFIKKAFPVGVRTATIFAWKGIEDHARPVKVAQHEKPNENTKRKSEHRKRERR